MNGNEIWKPVIGYEKFFEISNLGQLKRIHFGKGVKGQFPKGYVTKFGYHRYSFHTNKIHESKSTQKLVAEAFIGPRPKGKEINHKDGNKLNNYVDNLEYVTPKENVQHAIRVLKRTWGFKGEKHSLAKLTEENVRDIRNTKYTYGCLAAFATKFKVSRAVIS